MPKVTVEVRLYLDFEVDGEFRHDPGSMVGHPDGWSPGHSEADIESVCLVSQDGEERLDVQRFLTPGQLEEIEKAAWVEIEHYDHGRD